MNSPCLPAFAPTLDEAERFAAAHSFAPVEIDARERAILHQRQLAQAWQAAEQGRRACSALLAEMSQELRSPLSAIIGYSDRLLEDAEPSAEADLKGILTSSERLLRMLNHVLDASRAEARLLLFTPEEFDPCEALAELADGARPLAARHGNHLHVGCKPMGLVLADAPKIRHVLYSLLENACKFTQRGNITLRAWRDGLTHLRFEVMDDGMGMDPVAAADLFKGLQRANGASGMGLAACRKLCEVMGGTITVRSATGHGTIFTVIVPVTPAN